MPTIETLPISTQTDSAFTTQRLWIACTTVALTMLVVLRLMERIWWCECGRFFPISLQAWGPHNSQHLLDPYTFSHLLHGVIFYFAFNFGPMRQKPLLGLLCAMLLEAGWEIFENTPFTINRYRAGTAAVGYSGDSVFNSFGDLMSCVLGWWVARKIGLLWSVVLFFVLEIGCLFWIKDNLTVNVIMIVHPIDAIKKWQSGG